MQLRGMKNVAEIPDAVARVLRTLEAAGFEGWCVGGCVRDRLLGREPGDWDVTTSALPEQTLALFGDRSIPTGLQHGTVTVRTETGPVEVTTFRVDGAYRDHRRPEAVQFTASLAEDLARRDFTVNAMALNLRGELRDPFGGRQDLADRVLRCVGEPDRRFQEDALRILRGLRFSSVLRFSLEAETAASLRKNRNFLRDIAAERIWTEFSKLLCGADATEVLRTYPEVPGVFWPELTPLVGFQQRNCHHCYDIWEHSLHAMDAVPAEDLILRCAMLLHDVGKPLCFTVDSNGVGHFHGHPAQSQILADAMLRRLRCDTATRRAITQMVGWHDRDIPRTRQGICRALQTLGETALRRLIAVKRADNLAQSPVFQAENQREIDRGEQIFNQLLAENACYSLRQLRINGRDLIQLGVSGPEIGTLLNTLLDSVIEGTLPNERDALLAFAEQETRKNPGTQC